MCTTSSNFSACGIPVTSFGDGRRSPHDAGANRTLPAHWHRKRWPPLAAESVRRLAAWPPVTPSAKNPASRKSLSGGQFPFRAVEQLLRPVDHRDEALLRIVDNAERTQRAEEIVEAAARWRIIG